MTLPQWFILALALWRGLELVYAHRNARRLLAEGGQAHGDGHYPVIVGVHVGWLIALGWAGGRIAEPDWLLVALFVLLEAARLWVVVTLGRFWTTRVISVPEDLLLRIVNGEQSAMGAFLMGKIRVEGDASLAMRLKDLLG